MEKTFSLTSDEQTNIVLALKDKIMNTENAHKSVGIPMSTQTKIRVEELQKLVDKIGDSQPHISGDEIFNRRIMLVEQHLLEAQEKIGYLQSLYATTAEKEILDPVSNILFNAQRLLGNAYR